MTAPVESIDDLAILVVYLIHDDGDLALLQLHLDRIRRHTRMPYTVYAAANRTTAAGIELLGSEPNVVVCDITPTDLRGNREHAYYLDALATQAVAAGATHLVTLDIDSFPVDDRWIEVLAGCARPESGIAAILRAENGDSALPHPSCAFIPRAFFDRYRPSFSPDSDMTLEFRQFQRSTGQAADTGIRYGYILWSEQLGWGKLLRTNVRNPHYLVAGIYGDVVFHLGAGARLTLFRADLARSTAYRLTKPIDRLRPRTASMKRLKQRVLKRIRSKSERRDIDRNEAVAAKIRSWLFEDADALIEYLRGGTLGPSAPAWATEADGNGPETA